MADKDKAHLGCLEEDDEFEEFPAEGKRAIDSRPRAHGVATVNALFTTKHVIYF